MPRRPPGKPERCSRYLAIDCEMIQTERTNNYPAHISIVGYYGKQLLNVFIEPDSPVVNWRTSKSGISPEVYEKASDRGKVIESWDLVDMIGDLHLKDSSIFIGHSISNGLKRLTEAYFNVSIQYQSSGHDPLEDARASMLLFRTFQHEFEAVDKQYGTYIPKGTQPVLIDETTYY